MDEQEYILPDLIRARDEGIFVGLLIQLHEKTQFIITRVESILSDISDPSIKSILLRQPDITGKTISQNPVTLRSIKSIRVYKELRGVAS